MSISRYITALEVVNRVAPEVGLTPDANAFSSVDPVFIQLIQLLTSCGQDLVGLHDWQQLVKAGEIVTTGTPNRYSVPEDFSRFTPQTGWEDGTLRPLGGPLSPQLWAVAVGQNMASPIQVQYREAQDQFWLYPTDAASGITIAYEYIRRTWLLNGSTYKDAVSEPGDIVQFEPVLISRLLKWKFLAARGFATTDAKEEFGSSLSIWLGKGNSGPILSLGGGRAGVPLIQSVNAGETGYGG